MACDPLALRVKLKRRYLTRQSCPFAPEVKGVHEGRSAAPAVPRGHMESQPITDPKDLETLERVVRVDPSSAGRVIALAAESLVGEALRCLIPSR